MNNICIYKKKTVSQVDEDGVPFGDEQGALGFAETFLMDIGLFKDGCTITNRYWEGK